jgi:hypothetical protein
VEGSTMFMQAFAVATAFSMLALVIALNIYF